MGDLLWKQCAHWMLKIGIVPNTHRIFAEESDATFLAYMLRDGSCLCQIANLLAPGCIDNRAINQRPGQAQFLCLKNIRLFLKACEETFGLTKESDLFEPSMLYDFTDFGRVLNTLSKLSQTSRVRQAKPNLIPFPVNSLTVDTIDGPRANGFHDDSEEHIYKRMEDMFSEDHYKNFFSQGSRHRSQNYSVDDHEEEVYADICLYRRRGSGSSQTQQELRNELLANFKVKEKRDYCIRELIETEGNYVDALNMLRKNFIKPMVKLSDSEKKIIFINIKELGEIHAAFYTSLLESVSGKPSARRIGEIFVEFKDKFLKYGEYCSNLPMAQETLDNLCSKNEDVAHEVAACEKSTDNGRFRLRDLLSVPMQRILKYHLLLKELKGKTPESHEEFGSIRQALDAMIDVAEFINEVKRDSESIATIRETQASITDWTMPQGTELKDYGRLRRDGELRVHSHESFGASMSKNAKSRYIFVFDKVMLICKASRDHYSFKESLKLSEYRVEEIPLSTPGTGSVLSTPSFLGANGATLGRVMKRDNARWTHVFILAHVRNSHAYTLFARTAEEKVLWVNAIKEALDNITPRDGLSSPHDVYITTFTQPATCDACRKLLKGIFFQGYRCQLCNRAMHKECISNLPQCKKSSIPPAVPPRPASMQLPMATCTSVNRISSFSIGENRSPSLAKSVILEASVPKNFSFPDSSILTTVVRNGSNPDYVNIRLEDYPWFVGEMDRDMANSKLAPYPIYTFLVRCRKVNGEKVGFALSLKTDQDIKHMKIDSTLASTNNSLDLEEEENQNFNGNFGYLYYLSETRKFRSVVELVLFYCRNSLKESFNGLDTPLRFPIGEVSLVRAVHDFPPNAKHKTMLPFKEGDKLAVIDKSSEASGWWKAFNGRKIGYIPKDFVEPLETDS